jgi:hypothetical protein
MFRLLNLRGVRPLSAVTQPDKSGKLGELQATLEATVVTLFHLPPFRQSPPARSVPHPVQDHRPALEVFQHGGSLTERGIECQRPLQSHHGLRRMTFASHDQAYVGVCCRGPHRSGKEVVSLCPAALAGQQGGKIHSGTGVGRSKPQCLAVAALGFGGIVPQVVIVADVVPKVGVARPALEGTLVLPPGFGVGAFEIIQHGQRAAHLLLARVKLPGTFVQQDGLTAMASLFELPGRGDTGCRRLPWRQLLGGGRMRPAALENAPGPPGGRRFGSHGHDRDQTT